MPYFVYAIHSDETNNRLYGQYENYTEADKKEKELKAGNYPNDNYSVTMFFEKSLTAAEAKANALRNKPK